MSSPPVEPINKSETNTRSRGSDRADRGRRAGAKPSGRYDRRTQDTRLPPQGLGAPVSSSRQHKGQTVVAAVVDPMGNGRERLLATVNRRVDLLEMERSHDRLGEAAYRTGRLVQAIFERLGGVGASNWCGASRMDPALSQQLRLIRTLDSAAKIQAMAERMAARIGMRDTRLLRRVIGDRMSFDECAALEGKGGTLGASYMAKRFRDALEDLAEAWEAKGAPIPVPDDKHAAAMKTMNARQQASMTSGVSAARRAAEAEEARAAEVEKAAPMARTKPKR